MIAKILSIGRTAMLAVAAAFASAGMLCAQVAPGTDGIDYKGYVAGMKAYEIPGADGVWLVSPDGKTFINGMVYDLGGATPVINFKPVSAEHLPAFLSSPGPAGVSPAAPAGKDIVSDLVKSADAALAGVENAKKRALLADLVARMERATSPEEFKLLILEWQAEIEGNTAAASAAGDALKELKGATSTATNTASAGADSAPSSLRSTEEGARGRIAEPVLEAPEPSNPLAGDGQSDGAMLLDKMRHDGFWFSVGASEAPVVYAFIDPLCPYCARAIRNLKPEIDSGALQLRVLLAPAISRASYAKIAAILTAPDPVQAFINHEIQYAERGASSLPSVLDTDLPAAMDAGIRANYEMIFENRLPGVPFFGFQTADGVKFLSGVPQPGHFNNAVPDSYSGSAYRKSN